MRRIHFNEETISQIRNYIQAGHTIEETQNRFTLKYDTLRRVMWENNIEPYYVNKRNDSAVTSIEDIEDRAEEICRMFKYTNIPLKDIVRQSKLQYYVVLEILYKSFGEEAVNQRKSRMYRISKLGQKNPMYGKTGEDTSNFKGGILSDGQGYLMIKKPDWYTGRKGSDYVFYHHVVICQALGLTEIPKGFAVHHVDRNPHNNDISNLALMTIGAHSKLHSIEKNLCKVQRLSKIGVAEYVPVQCETPDNG